MCLVFEVGLAVLDPQLLERNLFEYNLPRFWIVQIARIWLYEPNGSTGSEGWNFCLEVSANSTLRCILLIHLYFVSNRKNRKSVLRYLLWIIRTYVRNLLGPCEVMVPHTPRDLPIRLVRSPFVPKSMYTGQYEPLETQFLLRNLARFSHFVNVGANLGWYSVIAGLQGRSIFAFEPDYLNAKVLKRNLKINGITNSRIVVAAASNQRGEAQLFGGNSGASLIPGWAGQPKVRRTVPMVTFDSVASLEKEEVFVIIDVEGHELPVLEGMRKHLRSWNCALIMAEITANQHHPSGNNPDRTSVFELMSSLGFAAWYLEEGGGVIPYQDCNQQTTSSTFIFTKGLLPS